MLSNPGQAHLSSISNQGSIYTQSTFALYLHVCLRQGNPVEEPAENTFFLTSLTHSHPAHNNYLPARSIGAQTGRRRGEALFLLPNKVI